MQDLHQMATTMPPCVVLMLPPLTENQRLPSRNYLFYHHSSNSQADGLASLGVLFSKGHPSAVERLYSTYMTDRDTEISLSRGKFAMIALAIVLYDYHDYPLTVAWGQLTLPN